MKQKAPILIASLTASLLCCLAFFSPACSAPPAVPPTAEQQAAQIQKISGAVEGFAAAGAAFYLQKNRDSAAYLLAAATLIEASANAGQLDPVAVQAALARQLDPGGAAALGSSLAGAFGLYQAFIGANVDATLDTRPAYKAALLAIARGVRSAASNAPASRDVLPTLRIPEDLVLR